MYAEAVGREQHARHSAKTLSGWCSWYYYFTKPSQAAIEENLAALQKSQESVPLDVVQIDDGYQTAVGDWTSLNERFPDGMAHLAERIRTAGYRPGLWLAPFTVAANSQLAHEHSDWLVRAPSGKPVFAGKNWGSELYGLDTSHPGAQEWLRALFSIVTREWGFDYLKLDFLASGAVRGRRYDPRVTRARALRDGLALIRETVGDDAFILGAAARCSARLALWTRCASGRTRRRAGVRTTTVCQCLVQMAKSCRRRRGLFATHWSAHGWALRSG